MSNIYIANEESQKMNVMVTLRPGWQVADFMTDAALLVTGVTELKAGITAFRALPGVISTVSDLIQVLKAAALTLSGSVSATSRTVEGANVVVDAFRKNSIAVPAGGVQNVYGSDFWTYFNPSAYADLLGANTMTLLVMSGDGKRFVTFPTNTDYSWIITSTGAVRAKYGHLWVHDPASGSYPWITQQ